MKAGLMVRSLPRRGFLFMSGLRPRDRVTAVNGHGVADELDFYYHGAGGFLEIEIERGGRAGTVEAERPAGAAMDVEFYEKPVDRCANRCVFCFIDQMPKGLRRSLYIKDEDFKHSFLNGNYVTLTAASEEDLRRIVSIGLSPLFVSVHATDPAARAAMLGRRRVPDVRRQLAYLSANGIAFHTQIVLCPGFNDGAVLDRTVDDLSGYGGSLLSIAVVPVGLTRFRKKPLAAVDRPAAVEACRKIGEASDRMKRRDGRRKLFAADELFIRAGLPIPPDSYYGDYPQIENGVGLVRRLLLEGAGVRRRLRKNPPAAGAKRKSVLVITGCSAYPFLKRALDGIAPCAGRDFDVRPVVNRYFGETVTVAGLLTAADVIREIRGASAGARYDEVVLPRAMFNHAGHTLDGYSPSRIASAAGGSGGPAGLTVKVAGTIEEMLV